MNNGVKVCRKCEVEFKPKPWQLKNKDYECSSCKRARQNKINDKKDLSAESKIRNHLPRVKKYQKEYHASRRSDPVYMEKKIARRKAYYALEKGTLIKTDCVMCGGKKSEAHHHDYSRPLDVEWMCRPCHMNSHRMEPKSMIAERDK